MSREGDIWVYFVCSSSYSYSAPVTDLFQYCKLKRIQKLNYHVVKTACKFQFKYYADGIVNPMTEMGYPQHISSIVAKKSAVKGYPIPSLSKIDFTAIH